MIQIQHTIQLFRHIHTISKIYLHVCNQLLEVQHLLLQYLKNYRLHKARMMIIHDGMKASAAAMRVGYESASQFSREFKRYFGVTPGEDAARMRAMQGN